MKQLRHIPIAVATAVFIGGLGLLPTFIPSVGTALAQEEEEVQTKQRGKKKSQGQLSKPGFDKKGKKKQGLVIEDKQKKSKKKTKSKKKKSKKSKKKARR